MTISIWVWKKNKYIPVFNIQCSIECNEERRISSVLFLTLIIPPDQLLFVIIILTAQYEVLGNYFCVR